MAAAPPFCVLVYIAVLALFPSAPVVVTSISSVRPSALRGEDLRILPGWKVDCLSSNESGRDEVYVRTYPGGKPKVAFSTAGGTGPLWSGVAGSSITRAVRS